MKGKEAERQFELILQRQGYDTHRVESGSRKMGSRWVTNNHDIFDCDVIGMCPTEMIFAQVTTKSGVRERRRRVEKHPWPVTDEVRVLIAEARAERDPSDRRRVIRYFWIHRYWQAEDKWERVHREYVQQEVPVP